MDTFEIAIALFFVAAVLIPSMAVWHIRRQRQRDEKAIAARMQRERERIAAQLAAIPKRGPTIRPVAPQSAANHSPARSFTPTASPSPPPQPDYLAQHLMWQNINSTSPAPAYEPPCRASSSDSYSSGSSSWSSGSSSDSSSSSSSDSGCTSCCD